MVEVMSKKVSEVMNGQNELVILTGKVYEVVEEVKRTTGQTYYRFRIKTMRHGKDIYSMTYNTYLCFMPADISSKNVSLMQNVNGKEVTILARPSCYVKTVKYQNGEFLVNDKFQLFVENVYEHGKD